MRLSYMSDILLALGGNKQEKWTAKQINLVIDGALLI